MCGASMLVGAVLAVWPPLAVVGIFVLAVLAARAAVGRALGGIALSLCLPLVGIGFSFSDVGTAAGLALVIVIGSAYALVISLLWPAGHPVDVPRVFVPPVKAMMVRFGYLAGATGAICAAAGFALDLEHVGWAPGAALLVMRPAPRMQEDRSVARIVDVVVGAAVAIVLVTLGAPAWVYSIAITVAVVCVTATAGSRWYVVPAFTTFLVFVMLLVDSPTTPRRASGSAPSRPHSEWQWPRPWGSWARGCSTAAVPIDDRRDAGGPLVRGRCAAAARLDFSIITQQLLRQ